MSIHFETDSALQTDLGIDSMIETGRTYKAPETLSERTRVQVALYTSGALEMLLDYSGLWR